MFIPGSNNGTFGMGASEGAIFPSNMGGPFGYQGYPIPIDLELPTGVVDKPYLGHAFGSQDNSQVVYELTPGGYTSAESWGFTDKSFGKSKSRRIRKSKSKKSKKSKKSRKSRKSRKSKKF